MAVASHVIDSASPRARVRRSACPATAPYTRRVHLLSGASLWSTASLFCESGPWLPQAALKARLESNGYFSPKLSAVTQLGRAAEGVVAFVAFTDYNVCQFLPFAYGLK